MVLYHAFPNLVPGGFIGVDVFFVISGFLITTIILKSLFKKDFSLKSFYSRRIRRLFPALLVVLVLTMVLGWLVLFPDEYRQAANHVKYSAFYWLNFRLIGELGYFDVESHYKPLLHLWSLSIEEQYYVFWPVIVLLIVRFSREYLLPFILVIALLSFAANIYYVKDYPNEVYFHTLTRVWQLAAGSALAIWMLDKNSVSNIPMLIIGVALILSGAWIISDQSIYPGWLALLPTIGAIFVILSSSCFANWMGLVKVGLISYPLYLWHWVILSFVTIYLGRQPDNLETFFGVLLSLGLAYLTWISVERVRYVQSAYIPIFLLMGLISIGVAGAYIKKNDGLPDRGHLDYLKQVNLQFERTPHIDDKCENLVRQKLSSERLFYYCRSDAIKSSKIIAVIGDSHAHAIFPGIVEEARNRGYGTLLLANSSCPTLSGFLWGKNKKEIDECQEMIEQILTVVKADTRIEKVFISTRGPVYMHGEVKGEFTEKSVLESLTVRKKSKDQNYESYFSGFDKVLNILNSYDSVKAIYYFLENPELDFLPKDVVIRPFDRWGISVLDSVVDLDLHKLRMKKYKQGMIDVGQRFSKLTIIDPTHFMCDMEKCYSYKNGEFLYADDDHFSVFGAKFASTNFNEVIFNE